MVSFREMAARIDGEDFPSRLARMSALAAASKFEPAPPVPFIRVDFLSGLPDAYALGQTIEQVHSATAQVAKWMRNHASAPDIGRIDRDRVRLVPRAAGRSIFFDFPDSSATSAMLVPDRIETLAEVAAFALIERLPQSADDDDTLDSLLSEPQAIKLAIDRLAKAASASEGIGLEVSTSDHRGEHAVITGDQARVLKENLNLPSVESFTLTSRGMLDGMRTRRRLFYLISGDDELSGAIEEDLLVNVRQHLGEMVDATIETTVITNPKGRSRTARRLIGVHPIPQLGDA